MASDDYLWIGMGFLGTLFIMKTFRALRPTSAKNMAMPVSSTGCSSCKGGR